MEAKNKKIQKTVSKSLKQIKVFRQLHSVENKLAEKISDFAGSMGFVYFHAVWFTLWILAGEGLLEPYINNFDPFPYGLLTMIVSLEAIFLATFIMINQNRQALVDEYRELEEEQEELEEEREQQELEEDVEDIQKDLDDIKNAISFIQQKVTLVEKSKQTTSGNGNGNNPH